MKLAKKLGLSIGVILVFIAYSYHQRTDGKSSVVATSTTPASSSSSSNSTQKSSSSGMNSAMGTHMSGYKDGTYTGDAADAFYGYIQVEVTIKGGQITDVQFLQYPNDRENSIYINSQAMPILKQEAIQAQSSHVNIVTGATDSSMAFAQSLSSALSKAS